MDSESYLRRIDYIGPRAPTLETLRLLHRAHQLSVPFENLDIHLGRPIVLDEEHLFEKVVTRRRGGFCYELNGLFATLLRELGYRVTMHGAEVLLGNHATPNDAHLALLVHLNETWVADVGFGDGFFEPLRFGETRDQIQDGRVFHVIHTENKCTVLERRKDGSQEGYRFDLTDHSLDHFREICEWTATSPDSIFTQKRIVTRASLSGRVTLSENKLIIAENTTRSERELDPVGYGTALREHFGIVLSDSSVDKLFNVQAIKAIG